MLRLNNLSVKFLKACGKSLTEIIAIIITAYLIFKYFLQHFRCAKVVMLIKSEKTGKIIYTLNIYRFIILHNAIDKIIKKIINDRIIAAVEKHNLLS
jgi:hypothetical protein